MASYPMFQLYAKLKATKMILKAKNLEVFGGMTQKVQAAREALARAQFSFLASHGNVDCQKKERECMHEFVSISNAEENFLKQKSRNQWLNLGDGNNGFFHRLVKVRNSSALIKSLKDASGNIVEDIQQIKEVATSFYQNLLGESTHVFSESKADQVSCLITKSFSSSCSAGMVEELTKEEVKRTISSMKKNKAPGPDGFLAGFYHKAWPIVGDIAVEAVLDFFKSGRLLKEVNATILSSVPKIKNPSTMGDYRPISCCNVIYKCITKILANRLLPGLNEIIYPNQGAFIPNRSIVENILLAQELVSDYHKSQGKPRCTLKVDLMKAYDSVDWSFVLHYLISFAVLVLL